MSTSHINLTGQALVEHLLEKLAEKDKEIERLTREWDERESTLASLCDAVNTFAREEGTAETHEYLSLSGVRDALSLVIYAQRKKLSVKADEIERLLAENHEMRGLLETAVYAAEMNCPWSCLLPEWFERAAELTREEE